MERKDKLKKLNELKKSILALSLASSHNTLVSLGGYFDLTILSITCAIVC